MTDGNSITTKAKFLCNLCDCVSIGNKGDSTVRSVFTQFNYANCYTSRVATKKGLTGTVQIKGDGNAKLFASGISKSFSRQTTNHSRRLTMLSFGYLGAPG